MRNSFGYSLTIPHAVPRVRPGPIPPAAVLWLLFFLAGAVHADDNDPRRAIIETAKQYLGVPYMYGAESPAAFDCSGFVQYVYRTAAGIAIPRSSKSIWASGQSVQLAAVQPGDIVVFNTFGAGASHVAILLDAGSIIHAVSEGPRTGVIISPLGDRYFGPRIIGAASYILPAAARSDDPPAEPPETSPIEPVGFTIRNEPVLYTDKVPAILGSGLKFAVTNGTGRDGVFEILFYKMDPDPAKTRTLRRDRVNISAGGTIETDPFIFTEPGQYKLILKTHDNMKRVERIWRVVEL